MIKTDATSVDGVFAEFYAVPDFQREYVWTDKFVQKLLDDLHTAYADRSTNNYFLGSIVFYGEGRLLYLVDGQQRMTTLFIFACAVRDRILEIDKDADVADMAEAIQGTFRPRGDKKHRRHRVTLQYPELTGVLETISKGKRNEGPLPQNALTKRRLLRAYRLTKAFLEDSVPEKVDDIQAFFDFVWSETQLITIRTEDLQSAYQVFETLNDRAKTLSAADLLKNLLFSVAARDDDKRRVRDAWKGLINQLDSIGEVSPIRFLRYTIMADYNTGKVIQAQDLFPWITDKKNRKTIGYDKPAPFAEELESAAESYARFSEGWVTQSKRSLGLIGIDLQGTGVRQHLCLALAGRHLSVAAFENLALALESLTFVFAVCKERWNKLESRLPEWSALIKDCENASDVDDFVSTEIAPTLTNYRDAFWAGLLNTTGMADRLRKYVVVRLAHEFGRQCGRRLSLAEMFQDVTVEHVFPQTPKAEHFRSLGLKEKDVDDDDRWFLIHRLGNLTVLDNSMNPSAGRQDFATKAKEYYAKSQYDITRSFKVDLRIGKAAKPRVAVAKYDFLPVGKWTQNEQEQREKGLVKLAQATWVALPTPPAGKAKRVGS